MRSNLRQELPARDVVGRRQSIADVESTRLDPARVKVNDIVAFQYSRGTRAGQERTVRIVVISEGEGH